MPWEAAAVVYGDWNTALWSIWGLEYGTHTMSTAAVVFAGWDAANIV